MPNEDVHGPADTFARRMVAAAGHPTGFDYLRLALALAVVAIHSLTLFQVTLASQAGRLVEYLCLTLPVPMFFGLGGFLVAGSLDRSTSYLTFAGLRALRILPALTVDTLFSALILGPLVTIVPLRAYFSDRLFFHYFLNIVGFVHYRLPGVFVHNGTDAVNAQLWSIPHELFAYILIALLSLLGLYQRRRAFAVATLIFMVGFPVIFMTRYKHGWLHELPFPCFLVGVACHLFRDRIVYSYWLAGASLLLIVAGVADPRLPFLLPVPIVYLTLFLGLRNPRRVWPLTSGDYSYGLYLYGYPLQQALIVFVPFARGPIGNLLLAIPIACVFAALSWHLVEKQALGQRYRMHQLENWLAHNRPALFRRIARQAPLPSIGER